MIFIFLVGGILFVLIDYVVNNLNDTSLGALISMIPIGFLSTLIINDYNNLIQYTRNMFFVICITITTCLIFYILLKVFNMPKFMTITIIIVLWSILQLLNYKFNYFKDEPKILDEKNNSVTILDNTDLKKNSKNKK